MLYPQNRCKQPQDKTKAFEKCYKGTSMLKRVVAILNIDLIILLTPSILAARIVREPWDTDKVGSDILNVRTMDVATLTATGIAVTNLTVSSNLTIPIYAQNTEPDISTDKVALWEDTDDNRWWFIWDEGETQYKMGFENASGELQWTPVWEEQRAHITQFYKPGVNYPSEGEIGVTPVLLFDATNDEWVYYEWEVPENYYTGSDFKIRFYWSPTDANTGDVVWGIEYTIVTPENDEVLTTTTTTATVTDSTQSLANELLRSDFITIPGTGVQPGDIISMRVYRDADADDYGADAALVHLGLYFKVDRNGIATTS